MISPPLETEKLAPESSDTAPRSPKQTRVSRIVYGSVFLMMIAATVYSGYLFRDNQKRVAALYLTRAKAQLRHDEFDAAHDSLKKAVLADSRDIRIQTELVKTEIFKIANQSDSLARLLDLQKLDKAEVDCKSLLDQNGETAELLALMGIIYAHKDQPIRAMEMYEKAAKLAPDYPNVRNYWGASAYQWQYPENWREFSAQKFNEAISLDPNYVVPRVSLAKLEEIKQPPNFEGADSIFSKAEETAKNNSVFYTSWGVALDEWGRSLQGNNRKVEAYQKFAEALEKYRLAAALEPGSALIHFDKANALGDMDRIDDALTEYRRAVELQCDFVEAHYAIAGFLLARETSKQTEIEEAIGHLNEAIKLTRQIIAQYNERIARKADAHALKRINSWTQRRAEEIRTYEEWLKKAKGKLGVSAESR